MPRLGWFADEVVLRVLVVVAMVAFGAPTGGCVTQPTAQPKKAPSCPYNRGGKRRVPYKRGPMKR